MKRLRLLFTCSVLAGCTCKEPVDQPVTSINFSDPVKVEVTGYTGHLMEPFLSRDGQTLFFNNLNLPPENTNIHWAQRINDTLFQYMGEVSGINTAALEGVATMDASGNFYFVSDRSYTTTFSTLYQCRYSNGSVTVQQLVGGVSRQLAGWVNFDLDVSADGQFIYFNDGQFDQNGGPYTADIVIAEKGATSFQRLANAAAILQNINSSELEYAPCISNNLLELYFTRATAPFTGSTIPAIYYATRSTITEAFGTPVRIPNITGFVEGPALSGNQQSLYFHKRENNKFVLYMVKRK